MVSAPHGGTDTRERANGDERTETSERRRAELAAVAPPRVRERERSGCDRLTPRASFCQRSSRASWPSLALARQRAQSAPGRHRARTARIAEHVCRRHASHRPAITRVRTAGGSPHRGAPWRASARWSSVPDGGAGRAAFSSQLCVSALDGHGLCGVARRGLPANPNPAQVTQRRRDALRNESLRARAAKPAVARV